MSQNSDSKKLIASSPETKTTKAKILVVEDEANVGSTLVERLEQQSYQVSWAKNKEEAELELDHQRFDLILLDIGLPDGSGFEIAERVRHRHSSTAVVFLSALGTPEHRIRGLELGAEDFVVKPFHFRELLLRIQASLKRANYFSGLSGTEMDFVQVGQARVHFSAFLAQIDGEQKSLSHKECALLRLLVERRGKAVSREEILREVWSANEYPSTRTVDNFIMRLRRLVEKNPEKPEVIVSVRGFGYQLL